MEKKPPVPLGCQVAALSISKVPDGDFPGGPVAKTVLPMQGAQVQPLIRELDPNTTTKSLRDSTKGSACHN